MSTESIRLFGNNLLLRDESWGLLLSDLSRDRVWGFDRNWKAHFSQLRQEEMAWSQLQEGAPRSSKPVLNQLRRFSTFSGNSDAIDPWLNDKDYFWGQIPSRSEFSLSGPIGVGWFLSRRCNSSCIYCCANSSPNASHKINIRQAKQIIDNLLRNGTLRLNIGGGEPTMFAGWEEILEYCCQRGLRPVMTTNGRSLNSSTCSVLADFCSLVQISLDSLSPKLHKRLRGDDDLSKVMHGIEKAISAGVNARVVTVLSRINESGLDSVGEWLWESGVRHWMIFALLQSGRAAEAFSELSISDFSEIKKRIGLFADMYPGMSVYLWGLEDMDRYAFNVSDEGDFVCHDYYANQRVIAGSLLHDDLSSIWSNVADYHYDYFLNWISGNRAKSRRIAV